MGAFSDSIKKFAVGSLAKAEAVRKDIIFDLFASIISSSPVDTGNFMANWNTSQGAPDLSFTPWGDGRNNSESDRLTNELGAFPLSVARIRSNIGNGLRRNTQTYLANSVEGIDGAPYGWKIEYGYPVYGWNANIGKPPPSENVLASGYSRHAPKGVVRINLGRIGDIVRRTVAKHGGRTV